MKAIAGAFAALKSGKGLQGQLMRGGVGSIAVKIASTGLNLILAIVLARLLGAEGFGIYSFVFALVTILAIPAQMGLPNLVVRETAKARVAERWDLIKGLWRWSSIVACAMSLGLVAIGTSLAFIFADRFTSVQMNTFAWALALVPLVALGNLRGAALRGLHHVVQGQLPEFILRPLFLIAFALGFAWVVRPTAFDPAFAMMLHVSAATGAFIIGATLLLRSTPEKIKSEQTYTTIQMPWLASALPMAAVEGINIVNQNIGVVMLGSLTTAEDVGIFRVALQGAALVAFGFAAANTMIGPHIARLHAQDDRVGLQCLVVSVADAVFLLGLPIALIIVVFGPTIISVLFGADFADAYAPLVIITLAQIVNAATACVGALLTMTGHERTVAIGMVAAAVITILSTFALVPLWGLTGAALANALGIITWNLYLVVRASRLLGIYSTAGANLFMQIR